MAKNRESAQLLTSLFRLRKVHKTYLAICYGEVIKNNGQLIKTTGDGFLAIFENCDDSLSFSIEIQNQIIEQEKIWEKESFFKKKKINRMILNDRQIKKLVEDEDMISPFVDKSVSHGISHGLNSFGFDLRCGEEFKIFTNIKGATADPKILLKTILLL